MILFSSNVDVDNDEYEICLIPPPLPESDSSEYHSLDGNDAEDEEPSTSSFYHDSEMSALNQSVFELSSEFEDHLIN